jgi:hypothetical protein
MFSPLNFVLKFIIVPFVSVSLTSPDASRAIVDSCWSELPLPWQWHWRDWATFHPVPCL